MEQKFEKNLFEKFGDFYSQAGKRALFSLGCIGFGVVVEFVLAGLGLGAIIAIFSVYNLLSICEKEKTIYIKTIHVTLPDGRITSCALFEQRIYAHAPLIMAFFSIGFYVPYKVQYILVRNMGIKKIPSRTRVPSSFATLGVLDIEVIPKSKYSAVISNPQIISDELYAQIIPRREVFLQETTSFVETGLMEEIHHTDYISIYKLCNDEDFILFHYEGHSGVQCGLLINKDYIEKIKEDDSFLLESYIHAKDPNVVFLTTEVLERLLRKYKNKVKQSTEISEGKTESENIEIAADTKLEVKKDYLDEINKNKKVFTKEIIASQLRWQKCTWRMILGIILLYFDLGAFALLLLGIGTGMVIASVISLPLGGLLTYFGVKNIKISNNNRKALELGQYKIIKVTCTSCVAKQLTDEDDNPCGYSYTHQFSNGDTLKRENALAVSGDQVYLLYLNNKKKISAFFNSVEYIPATDLIIEECL